MNNTVAFQKKILNMWFGSLEVDTQKKSNSKMTNDTDRKKLTGVHITL
jgi:hypothetical protein